MGIVRSYPKGYKILGDELGWFLRSSLEVWAGILVVENL